MEQYKEKMTEFVNKLLSNPALANAVIVKKENQILSFIKENQSQLQAAFARPEQFPDISWDNAVRLLLTILTDKILSDIEPRLNKAYKKIEIDGVIEHFRKEGSIDQDKMHEFILQNMRTKLMRDHYIWSIESIFGNFFSKYIPPIIERRKVIYIELIRRDRLTIETTLIPGFFGLVSLFRPLFFYKFNRKQSGSISLAETSKNPKLFESVFPEFELAIKEEIGPVPEVILRYSMESHLNCTIHLETSGVSRLISIISNRTTDYDPSQKVDKGAESPDKSWFNIHRRTAKFYGLDPHFLDELYQVASEEGW